MWDKNVGTTFFHFVTNQAFDRRTDGHTARPRWLCMQRGKDANDISLHSVRTF